MRKIITSALTVLAVIIGVSACSSTNENPEQPSNPGGNSGSSSSSTPANSNSPEVPKNTVKMPDGKTYQIKAAPNGWSIVDNVDSSPVAQFDDNGNTIKATLTIVDNNKMPESSLDASCVTELSKSEPEATMSNVTLKANYSDFICLKGNHAVVLSGGQHNSYLWTLDLSQVSDKNWENANLDKIRDDLSRWVN